MTSCGLRMHFKNTVRYHVHVLGSSIKNVNIKSISEHVAKQKLLYTNCKNL